MTFAGITTPTFPVYPVEDHFAEKLHAVKTPAEMLALLESSPDDYDD